MSMIVFKAGWLATDSQFLTNTRSKDEIVTLGQKLFISEDQTMALASAGYAWKPESIAEVFEHLRLRLLSYLLEDPLPTRLQLDEALTLLLVGPEGFARSEHRFIVFATQGRVWNLCTGDRNKDGSLASPIDVEDFYSIGSEPSMAAVYHSAGLTAEQVIQRIARISNTCGGDVQKVDVRTLKPLVQRAATKPTVKRKVADPTKPPQTRKPRKPREPKPRIPGTQP